MASATGSYPIRFTPRGLSDAKDATDAFPGACRILRNLIFDPQNPEQMIARPGVGAALTTFSGFTSPTFVTCFITIGDMVYGMVATGRTSGHDEPFAFNLATGSFVTVSGVSSGNVPTSPATTGSWTPPTMAVVGTKILVTHPGFSGSGSNFFGVIDIATPASPAWSAHNLATSALPGVPTSVANFANRAYFSVGNVSYFSDVLDPLTRTNATQSVTLGDPTPIVAQIGLPVQTTSGGVVQALVIFKENQVWQVTGDVALSNLAVNFLTLTCGTSSPRTVAQTPVGIMFSAVDGPYHIDLYGQVRLVTKNQADFPDLQAPFQNMTEPSRAAATFSGGVYRVCMPTIIDGRAATNDYWFNTHRGRWTGPHTFIYDCAAPYGNDAIVSSYTRGAALYRSQSLPTTVSVYYDEGSFLDIELKSSAFSKEGAMKVKQVIESTVELSNSAADSSYTVTAYSESDTILNSVVIQTVGGGTVWGAFNWGEKNWTSASLVPGVYTIPWTVPLVFQKIAIGVQTSGNSNVAVGTFFARYKNTGYLNNR